MDSSKSAVTEPAAPSSDGNDASDIAVVGEATLNASVGPPASPIRESDQARLAAQLLDTVTPIIKASVAPAQFCHRDGDDVAAAAILEYDNDDEHEVVARSMTPPSPSPDSVHRLSSEAMRKRKDGVTPSRTAATSTSSRSFKRQITMEIESEVEQRDEPSLQCDVESIDRDNRSWQMPQYFSRHLQPLVLPSYLHPQVLSHHASLSNVFVTPYAPNQAYCRFIMPVQTMPACVSYSMHAWDCSFPLHNANPEQRYTFYGSKPVILPIPLRQGSSQQKRPDRSASAPPAHHYSTIHHIEGVRAAFSDVEPSSSRSTMTHPAIQEPLERFSSLDQVHLILPETFIPSYQPCIAPVNSKKHRRDPDDQKASSNSSDAGGKRWKRI